MLLLPEKSFYIYARKSVFISRCCNMSVLGDPSLKIRTKPSQLISKQIKLKFLQWDE